METKFQKRNLLTWLFLLLQSPNVTIGFSGVTSRRSHHSPACSSTYNYYSSSSSRSNNIIRCDAEKQKKGQNTSDNKTQEIEKTNRFFGLLTKENDEITKITSDASAGGSSKIPPQNENEELSIMGDLTQDLMTSEVSSSIGEEEEEKKRITLLLGSLAIVTSVAAWSLFEVSGVSLNDIPNQAALFFENPQVGLEQVSNSITNMGPLAPLYFGFFYTIAEVLAIPATPLTMSAGYLFGATQGTIVVLISASIAASISFLIGKTVLRKTFENVLDNFEDDKFRKIDKAIGKQGFKLMFLLRLSPLFPFALSNYLYGASSINFSAYFWGTLLGFAPGTFAYVYTGMVGKVLTDVDPSSAAQPWYIYASGAVVLGGILKVVADVATNIIDDLDDE